MSAWTHWGVFFRSWSGARHCDPLLMQCDAAGRNALGWQCDYYATDRADAERYLIVVILNGGCKPDDAAP